MNAASYAATRKRQETKLRNTQMEERLTELEIKISFMEDQVDALNTLLYRQQQQMDLMIGELCGLREQVNHAQPNEARNLRDEIPPHY